MGGRINSGEYSMEMMALTRSKLTICLNDRTQQAGTGGKISGSKIASVLWQQPKTPCRDLII